MDKRIYIQMYEPSRGAFTVVTLTSCERLPTALRPPILDVGLAQSVDEGKFQERRGQIWLGWRQDTSTRARSTTGMNGKNKGSEKMDEGELGVHIGLEGNGVEV